MHKLQQGELDGLTLVFTEGLAQWTKVSEVAELKEELQKLAMEEEALESARRASEEQAKSVFEAHEDDDAMAKASDEFFRPKKDRHFTADDGTRYRWNDVDQEWEAMEGHGDHSEDDESRGGDNGARGAGNEEEDDGEGEEDDSDAESHTKARHDGGNAEQKKKRKKRKKKSLPNTWVYVSGLPGNISCEEIKEHFSKVSQNEVREGK